MALPRNPERPLKQTFRLDNRPKECKTTPDGKEYMGTKSVTKSGWKCQTWSSDSPQSHRYNDPEDDSMYPDGSVAAAK